LRTARDAVVSVVFPAPCRICAKVLDTASRVPVCAACLASFSLISPPWCTSCGRPVVSHQVADSPHFLCRLCRLETYGFGLARSFAYYDEPMVRAILLLKHDGITPLASWFADRLVEVAACDPEHFAVDVVVPVPLHPARLRERGYNQAELIARPLARKLHLKLGPYLLARTKPRPDKLRLTQHERWDSVRGAYETRAGVRVDNLHVLLVDDVMTTGATLDACSRALRKAGAASVTALTVARAIREWVRPGNAPVSAGV
ncbi:MAG: ComF family protein, partial [Candidatus Acidiferrales bacterium]